jgi:hypothetical protein
MAAAAAHGTGRGLLIGAGGMALATLLMTVRWAGTTLGPKGPWLFTVLAASCAIERPGVGMAVALVTAAFPFQRDRPYRVAALACAGLGAAGWIAGWEVAVLVAIGAKTVVCAINSHEPPQVTMRRVAARLTVVSGVVLVVDMLHRSDLLAAGLPGSWVDVAVPAGAASLCIVALTVLLVAPVYGIPLVALAVGAVMAVAGSANAGLLVGGAAGVAAGAVTLIGGRPLIRRMSEACRLEVLRGRPPIDIDLVASPTR